MGAGSGSALPPSRFGAGYTAGTPGAPTAVPSTSGAGLPSGGRVALAAPQRAGSPTLGDAAPGSLPQNGGDSGYAAVALVLAVSFGVFAVPVTIPMAFAARLRSWRAGAGNAATANAALIIGAIYLIIGLTAAALWFATSDVPTV